MQAGMAAATAGIRPVAGLGTTMEWRAIMAQETRDVADFDHVVVRDYGERIITQGSEESLTIEADEEILRKIEAQVTDRR